MLFCSNAVLRLIGFAYRAALLKSAGSEAMGLYSLVMQIYAVVSAVCVYGFLIVFLIKVHTASMSFITGYNLTE